MRKSIDVVRGIEGENDFSGKRYVWLRDSKLAFVKGWVVEELEEGRILVQCDDGSVSQRWKLVAIFAYSSSCLATGGRARKRR